MSKIETGSDTSVVYDQNLLYIKKKPAFNSDCIRILGWLVSIKSLLTFVYVALSEEALQLIDTSIRFGKVRDTKGSF